MSLCYILLQQHIAIVSSGLWPKWPTTSCITWSWIPKKLLKNYGGKHHLNCCHDMPWLLIFLSWTGIGHATRSMQAAVNSGYNTYLTGLSQFTCSDSEALSRVQEQGTMNPSPWRMYTIMCEQQLWLWDPREANGWRTLPRFNLGSQCLTASCTTWWILL